MLLTFSGLGWLGFHRDFFSNFPLQFSAFDSALRRIVWRRSQRVSSGLKPLSFFASRNQPNRNVFCEIYFCYRRLTCGKFSMVGALEARRSIWTEQPQTAAQFPKKVYGFLDGFFVFEFSSQSGVTPSEPNLFSLSVMIGSEKRRSGEERTLRGRSSLNFFFVSGRASQLEFFSSFILGTQLDILSSLVRN